MGCVTTAAAIADILEWRAFVCAAANVHGGRVWVKANELENKLRGFVWQRWGMQCRGSTRHLRNSNTTATGSGGKVR